MPGYQVCKINGKYVFKLFQTNSNFQELGVSVNYDSKNEFLKALEKFRCIVKLNIINDVEYDAKNKKINLVDAKYIRVKKERCESKIGTHNGYIYEILDSDGNVIFKRGEHSYQTMQVCKKGIMSVIDNVDTKVEKGEN